MAETLRATTWAASRRPACRFSAYRDHGAGCGTGPRSGLGDITGNKFNPAGFFADAKILGGIDLASLIDGVVTGLDKPEVPKLLSRETDDTREASFDWSTSRCSEGQRQQICFSECRRHHDVGHARLVSARKDSDEPTFSATATLVNFKINVPTPWSSGSIGFNTARGRDRNLTSSSICIPRARQSNSWARSSLSRPAGYHSVERFQRSAGHIGNSQRHQRKLLAQHSVDRSRYFRARARLAGRGFLTAVRCQAGRSAVQFLRAAKAVQPHGLVPGRRRLLRDRSGTEGVREIEAALEFGAALSINLGVASGSVEIKAGVYYHWKTTLVELEGYVRLHGELSVLGLISASLTFNLKLGYTKQNARVSRVGRGDRWKSKSKCCSSASVFR